MDEDETFSVTVGNIIRGDVTFWKTKNGYMYQAVGIGEPTRCTKKIYDEAKALFEEQQLNV